jgi:methionyl-tRNA synthetase
LLLAIKAVLGGGATLVTFAEFKKMDLRVGKVVSVEMHPNAEKLYVMKIDTGGEVKQSVTSLKDYYTPEQLSGKTVVVVANLEPAKLRGVDSEVMILAAQHNNEIVIIVPEREMPAGSKVL